METKTQGRLSWIIQYQIEDISDFYLLCPLLLQCLYSGFSAPHSVSERKRAEVRALETKVLFNRSTGTACTNATGLPTLPVHPKYNTGAHLRMRKLSSRGLGQERLRVTTERAHYYFHAYPDLPI